MIRDSGALILRRQRWNDYVLLALKSPHLAGRSHPGQFLMVRVSDRSYPLLRRPFSIHNRDKEVVEIFFAQTGLGTAMLAAQRPGETLDVLGPLGKGFSIPRSLKGKTACLVGGGRGIAPLYFLAQELRAKGIKAEIFYGGRAEDDLPLLRKLGTLGSRVFVSTDDGSHGFRGLISAMLEEELARRSSPASRAAKPAYLYACGPDPMMKKVAEIAARHHIPAQVSLESIMGCGIGACWGCVKKIERGGAVEWVKICEEGPVFPASEVVWEEEGR